jgi:hypothetical protein
MYAYCGDQQDQKRYEVSFTQNNTKYIQVFINMISNVERENRQKRAKPR